MPKALINNKKNLPALPLKTVFWEKDIGERYNLLKKYDISKELNK